MGPTNTALVKLFLADRDLQKAEDRLDAATREVRIQRRRAETRQQELEAARQRHKEHQVRRDNLELDVKSRDAQIQKLRTQQQEAKTNRDYQAFLVEINTQKVDRGKAEEQALTAMQQADDGAAEVQRLEREVEQEKARAQQMDAEIGDKATELQAEVDRLRPERDARRHEAPEAARNLYDRLFERYDGEPMASIERISDREERYACTACNMELSADVYNRLHTRDEALHCSTCGRLLYIPEDLTPELAVKQKKKATGRKTARQKKDEQGREMKQLLMVAEAESIKAATREGQPTVKCSVAVVGKLIGSYQGLSVEHLEQQIRARMQAAGLIDLPLDVQAK